MAKAKKNEIVIKEEKVENPNVDLTEIKKELSYYIDSEIKKGFNEEVRKANNKLLREKNKKIFARDIVIVILIALVGFLVYLLYSVNYFDKFFNKTNNPGTNEVVPKPDNTEVVVEDEGPTLAELTEEFGFLINNIQIDETSNYVLDFYNGNMTSELKNYLALNLLEFNNLTVDDDCNVIDSDVLQSAYYKLFDEDINLVGFDYNGNKVKYLNKLGAFVTTSVLNRVDSNIKREIINIEVEEDVVKITTVEGIIINDRLYNVLTNEEVKKYKKDNIANYQDKLNTLTYTFYNGFLKSISK